MPDPVGPDRIGLTLGGLVARGGGGSSHSPNGRPNTSVFPFLVRVIILQLSGWGEKVKLLVKEAPNRKGRQGSWSLPVGDEKELSVLNSAQEYIYSKANSRRCIF